MPKHIVISGTSFWNPGDDFVRDGVIRILRNLFPGEVVNLHFYNFNADYFPKEKFSGISNEVLSGDLDKLAPFVDAVVVAGLSAGHEINDLYQWVISNGLQDRIYLVGAGYENDYVAKHVDQEPAATIFRNARVITGRTRKTPAFMQSLPYHHINCPAILSVEDVKQVAAGRSIERVGFSIQLSHEHGVINHACAQAMYDLAIEFMAELAPQCQIEVIAHHKSEYFHFLNLFKQHDIGLPVVFSSFYRDLHSIYPRYDLIVTTRLHAALFANGFGIPAIIINDTDRHTHCMKGFPHVLQAADRLSFAAALDRIQQWDLCAVAEEAAAFKQQLLGEYVRTLAPAFGIVPTSVADAGGARAFSSVAGIAQNYKFDSEQREQLLVRRLVRPGMTVLDVGANIGKYTKLFSLLTGEKGRVYTFEPSKYAFGRLAEDVRRYGCGNVTLINKAVCAQCGTVTLNEFPERYCSWNSMGRPQMENPENLAELVPIARSVDVEALTLDAFCTQQEIGRIEYLKLDVEGAELDALKGAEGLLRRQAVDWIQFEISKKMLEGMGRRAREVFELLASHGYACHEITDQGEIGAVVDDSDSFYANYIAAPSVQRNTQELPVHFFTIVLNGEPFIQYHIEAFRDLPYQWHWHIVEGVAALKHDTAWSVAQGGRITDALHRDGLSNDGTSDYLDRLAAEYPDNITVYRKPGGEFWDGKLEMVNAPLSNIQESCLLWQIDADELWTREQLIQARELFLSHPDRTAAYYWCNYFVGERLVTSTRDTYGNNSEYEWLRTWRFSPGCRWTAHEPPRLCTPNDIGDWVDLASQKVLSHQETELAGLVFHHYAYVTEAQLSFKEDYYGYRNAVEQWRSLQSAVFPAALKDYFSWVTDGTRVDTLEAMGVEPLATRDDDGQWCFKYPRREVAGPQHILWVRTDAIGDNILASSMLPALRAKYSDSVIIVVCQHQIGELYRNCPYVDQVMCFDVRKFTQDEVYRHQFINSLNAFQPDLVLNSVYSREPLTDELCLAINAAERIVLSGDLSNMPDNIRQQNNARYSRVIESLGVHKTELERHHDFLAGLDIDIPALQPCVWTDFSDADFAEEIFQRFGFQPERTIILAPGAKWDYRIYPHYAEVVAPFSDYDLLVVGGPEDVVRGNALCRDYPGRSVNLAAQTSLTQTAELMRRCRLVVSSESSSAHLACAVGVANVVVTGGGHFGRFMPYSPLTAVVCLPLECYGCNWLCPHANRHCIRDIDPTVVIDAIRHQLESDKLRATLFVNAPGTWHPIGSMPAWKMNTYLTQITGVDVRIVSSIAGMDAPDPVAAEQAQDISVSMQSQVEMLNQQGEQCFLDGNKELAKACFAHALELDPEYVTTYNNMAVIHWRSGEQAQAMQFLAQGMELESGNRDLVINGVQMLRDCGEQDKADDLCRSYLADFPQDDEMRAILEGTVSSTDTTSAATRHPQSIMALLRATIGSINVKQRVLANLERLAPDIYLTRNLEAFRAAIQRGDAWFDSPTLLNWYACAFKPATYLEVGVRRGRSMAQVLMGSPECRCFGFDMWIPNYSGVDNPGPEFVLREMRKLRARKVPVLIEGNSHDTLPAFWENPASPQLIDLIYIDGDHTYEGAKLDLDLAFLHLADSGVLIFDDIDHSSHPELYPLWNEYKNRYPEYLFIEDHAGNGTACAFKPPFIYLETYLRELQNNTDILSDAEVVAELIKTGEQLFITEDYEEAREKFELALSKDPGNADALNNLCVLAWRTGDREGATKYLTSALTQECPSKEILENGAQILNDMMGDIEQIDALGTKTNNGQGEVLTTVLQAREANLQGEALFAIGAIDKAAQAFLAALVADPNSVLAHSNLAALFWYLGDQREALRYLAAGIQCPGLFKEIMENGAKILSAIANGLDEGAEPAETPSETTTQTQSVASSTFSELLAAEESAFNAGDVPCALGFIDQLGDETIEAFGCDVLGLRQTLEAARLAVRDKLGNAADHLNAEGEVFYAQGDIEAASECFKKARIADPNFTASYNNLIVLYWESGQTDLALDILADALEHAPNDRDLVINGAQILAALELTDEAQGLCERYLETFPDDAAVRALLSAPAAADKTETTIVLATKTKIAELHTEATRGVITVATSIAPVGIEKQQRAVASWLALGFRAVSLNTADEIAQLKDHFPQVEFITVNRDGKQMAGKPYVFLDDVLRYLRDASGSRVCGIVNSDIILRASSELTSYIWHEAEDALVYGSRVDIQSADAEEGSLYNRGFDFFFFDRSVIARLPKTNFMLGVPWWDYWVPVGFRLAGVPIKRLDSRIAYHVWHTTNYSTAVLIKFGYEFTGHCGSAAFLSLYTQCQEARFGDASLSVLSDAALDYINRNTAKIAIPGLPGTEPMRGDRPRVSAIVSTYMSAGFIGECLADLTGQTIADRLEIIVIDAASPEDERSVVAEYQRRFPHIPIRYQRTESRIGVYAAWNMAARMAQGDYLISCSTNDRLRQDACEIMARTLDETPDVALVYGNSLMTQKPHQRFDAAELCSLYLWTEYCYEDLVDRCMIGPHPMWRRSVHEDCGYFDEGYLALGDQDFWLRLGETYTLKNIPDFTGLYYVSEDSLTGNHDIAQRETDAVHFRYQWRYRYAKWLQQAGARKPAYAEDESLPAVHVMVLAPPAGLERVADTLDALGVQQYPQLQVSILADQPAPDPALLAEAGLNWLCYQSLEQLLSLVNETASTDSAGWLCLIDAGSLLTNTALNDAVRYSLHHQEWQMMYVDDDCFRINGEQHSPRFKPDFNLSLLRSQSYIGNCVFIRPQTLLELGGLTTLADWRGGDLALRIADQYTAASVGHIPRMLVHYPDDHSRVWPLPAVELDYLQAVRAHLQRRGLNAEIVAGLAKNTLHVRPVMQDKPFVSVIVHGGCTRELQIVVQTLLAKTDYAHYEVLVMHADESQLELSVPPGSDKVRVLSGAAANSGFDLNAAASMARGEYLIWLDGRCQVLQQNWIQLLLMQAVESDVGIVGARLVDHRKLLLDAGITLGMGTFCIGSRTQIGLHMGTAGYMSRAQCEHDMSAVNSLCMLVRKTAFDAAGGFATDLTTGLYRDVDFSLKVQSAGWRIVWTPVVTLMFLGTINDADRPPKSKLILDTENTRVLDRWFSRIAHETAYNRNLSHLRHDYQLELNTVPSWDPVVDSLPRMLGFGVGSYGSWQYRVVQPLLELDRSNSAQCANAPFPTRNQIVLPTAVDIEHMQPDTLLMHNTLHEHHIETLERYKKYNDVFVVFGQDDLMFALPPKNPYSKTVYKDMKKRIRRCAELADCLVVTTEPLAQALSEMSADVRVVPNYLSGSLWGSQQSKRQQGSKPRVGWAGAQQHGGDLELIAEVVAATANEVDWIFFGMCPDVLRPYVAEYHRAISFENYPEKLASLNLDLAIAPLERNRFNEAKSNLRVLEYGVLGWPVIASDIHPYQTGPLCRVPNSAAAWIRAIREHCYDLQALGQAGDTLQIWVKKHWMLEDHLDEWLTALQPTRMVRPVPRYVKNI